VLPWPQKPAVVVAPSSATLQLLLGVQNPQIPPARGEPHAFRVSAHQAVSLACMPMGLLKPNLQAWGGKGNFSWLEGNGMVLKLAGSCSPEHRHNQTSAEVYQLHPMHYIPSCQQCSSVALK